MFPPRDADQRRIEIDAVGDKALGRQEPRVLTGATCDVEHGLTPGVDAAQQAGDLRRLGRVVLERRVEEIVELRRRVEHLGILYH